MKKIFFYSTLLILLALAGCKTNSHLIKCPELTAAKRHHEIWARSPKHKDPANSDKLAAASNINSEREKNEAVASFANDDAFQIKVPRIITRKLNDEELQGANEIFTKYSENKVRLEKNDKGKIYLKADSKRDFFSLVKSLSAIKKNSPPALPDGGGGLAVAGGILGIIAIILALGPYVSYSAFLLGLLALIFGIIGLGSARRGWAVTAIVLGVLAILFAGVIGIGVYTVVLHI